MVLEREEGAGRKGEGQKEKHRWAGPPMRPDPGSNLQRFGALVFGTTLQPTEPPGRPGFLVHFHCCHSPKGDGKGTLSFLWTFKVSFHIAPDTPGGLPPPEPP